VIEGLILKRWRKKIPMSGIMIKVKVVNKVGHQTRFKKDDVYVAAQ
jgi:hypothetical protein